MYYVYEWYIKDSGEIFYVGKGSNERYKVKKRNKMFNDIVEKYECESRIIKEFENEQDAFKYEYERIENLKEIGQCSCNIYKGGAGGSGEFWTDELRKEYSDNNIMKADYQRKRMSKNNPMKNHIIAEKVNSQKRIPIVIGNIEYESIKSACRQLNVPCSTINSWIIRGETTSGKKCYYKDSPNNVIYKHTNNGKSKPLIYDGVYYKSTGELSRALNISQTTASRWCRQGRDSCGIMCRYIDSNIKYDDIHLKQKGIPIIVNGIWYPSKEEASRKLGVSSFILTQYLKGKKHDNEYICEYGNQQPSQGNVSKSTLEGSTTSKCG